MKSSLATSMVLLSMTVAGLGLSACGSSSTPTTTTTTQPAVPVAPLSGLPDPGGAALHRPAMTVKIENDPNSLPQWGVDKADVVYEEIVNGGITRLAAIFNQNAPQRLEPVRSVRPTDTQIVWPLKGLFVYSGGAKYAVDSISTAPVQLIDESRAGAAMYRDPNKYAPYNLIGVAPKLFALATTHTPPPALFHYRHHAAAKGPLVARVVVPFPSIYPVTWTYVPSTDSWNRGMNNFSPAVPVDRTGTGAIESPKNVVVMWVKYLGSYLGAMNSYGYLQGSGPVAIFTNGHEEIGTWSRGASKGDVVQYHDAKGHTLLLTPGQSWVEVLNSDAPALQITRPTKKG
jgi:hypothetical protein